MTADQSPSPSLSLERRVLTVSASVLLHLVLLAGGAVVTAASFRMREWTELPREPLLVMAVALVLAHSSLGAIWWARTSGSLYVRTALAMLAAVGMWALLLLLLDNARASDMAWAAWAACFATQVLLTATVAIAIEFFVDRRAAAARSRFSIGFVFVLTTVLAAILGGVGAWGARSGWKVADIAQWTYFFQLQAVGAMGAALAGGIYAGLRLPQGWIMRSVCCLALIVAAGAGAPQLFASMFANVGASRPDIAWLFVCQGLFLVVSLMPLQALCDANGASG